MSQPLHLLIVEDTEDDVALLQHTLRRAGYAVTGEVVDTPAAMRAALESQDWDMITSDHAMPQFSAPAALELAKKIRPEVPFIIVSGEIDINLAVSLMKAGAHDYIQKRELARVVPAIERELREVELRREQQRAEEALLESDERYHLLFQSMDSGFALHEIICDVQGVPCDYRFLEINPAFEKLTGLKAEVLIGHTIMEMLPGSEKEWIERYGRVALTGEAAHFENYSAELGKYYEVAAYSPKQGQFAVIFQDITERKRAEEALRVTLAKYKTLFEHFPLGITVSDGAGNILESNPIAEKLLGVPQDEQNRRDIDSSEWRIVRTDGTPMPPDEFASVRALKEKRLVENMEMGILKPDKTITWLSVTAAPLPGEGQGVVITYGDITQRKQVEQALRESEERYKNLFESNHSVTLIIDPDSAAIMDANGAACAYYGWSREELLKKKIDEINTLTNEEVQAEIQLAKVEKRNHFFFKHRRADGSIRDVEVYSGPVMQMGKTLLHSIIYDVNERKLAEFELLKFKLGIERSADAIFITDPQGTIVYTNPSFEKIYGFTPSDSLGHTPRILKSGVINPENYDQFWATLLNKGIVAGEIINKTKDGRLITIEGSNNPILDVAGNIIGFLAIHRDITARKQAEETLRASERRTSEIVDNAPFGAHLYELGSQQRLVFIGANRAADSILGVSHQQFVGKTIEEAFPSLSQTDIPDAYRRVAATGEHYDVDQVDYADGGIRGAFEVHAFQTSPNRMATFFRDITERKRVEAALQTSEERYRHLIQSANDLIWEVDLSGNYTFVSAQSREMLGYEPSELIGLAPFDLMPPGEAERVGSLFQAYIKERKSFRQLENINLHKDGHPVVLETNGVPTFDANGNFSGYCGMDRDITERKRAEREVLASQVELQKLLAAADESHLALLYVVEDQKEAEEQIRRLNTELEQRVAERTAQLTVANQELEAFSASVSHDLRAPLRSLEGFSTALLEDYAGQLDEQGQGYLARIQEASRRMKQLIQDLLNLSRVTRADFTRQAVDLSGLAENIAAELQAQSAQGRVKFEIAADMTVQGDENLLKIVLENLLNNAYKFTSQREQAIIQVGTVEQDLRQVYFVRDNGAGFDMKYANKLFGAFQRLHGDDEFPGTGIGLATVQRIIHRHGGRVWAEGAVDKGATFYFTLGKDWHLQANSDPLYQ